MVDAGGYRFVCQRCDVSHTVFVPGVLPRLHFTLGAIVAAWYLVVIEALDHTAVCAQLGAERPTSEGRAGRPRWRSLARWAGRIEDWWPKRAVHGTTWSERAHSLLAGFIPGGGGRDEVVKRAVAAHVAAGAAM